MLCLLPPAPFPHTPWTTPPALWLTAHRSRHTAFAPSVVFLLSCLGPSSHLLRTHPQGIQPSYEVPMNRSGGHFKLSTTSSDAAEEIWRALNSQMLKEALPKSFSLPYHGSPKGAHRTPCARRSRAVRIFPLWVIDGQPHMVHGAGLSYRDMGLLWGRSRSGSLLRGHQNIGRRAARRADVPS